MNNKKTTIHIQVDKKLTKEFQKTCKNIGVSQPQAIRAFMLYVTKKKEIPFKIKL